MLKRGKMIRRRAENWFRWDEGGRSNFFGIPKLNLNFKTFKLLN